MSTKPVVKSLTHYRPLQLQPDPKLDDLTPHIEYKLPHGENSGVGGNDRVNIFYGVESSGSSDHKEFISRSSRFIESSV